jgi:hypothetical protein
VADEIAFWQGEDGSANPDVEILRAVRPTLLTTHGPLIAISSPYARRGELWTTFKRDYGAQGDPRILVAHAASREMNPTLRQVDNPARVAAPRDGSKLAQVIELLRRADGATIVDLTQATGWLPHTTRAALTGLRKRGYTVIRDRIGAGDPVYRVWGAPADRGDCTVRQRDATDGYGSKQKATQAA